MVDGAASLMTSFYGLHAAGLHGDARGENILDSGAPYYACYHCAYGKYIAVAAIEKRFCRAMFERIRLDPASLPSFDDPAHLGPAKDTLTATLRSWPRHAWIAMLEGRARC